MSEATRRGILCEGQDASMDADETLKSNLLLEAQMLHARRQSDEAAARRAAPRPYSTGPHRVVYRRPLRPRRPAFPPLAAASADLASTSASATPTPRART